LVTIGALYLIHELVPSIPSGVLWPIVMIAIGAYILFMRR
jgi:hypothetical protein